jgi:putative ABC transport system permease protein
MNVPPPVRSGSRGGTRIALRLAWRSAVQARGRSILIVALIAIPIVGLSGLATVVTSMLPTTQETIATQLGHTQAMLTVVIPADSTLTQSPNQPSYYEFAANSKGATHHKESDPLVAPSQYLAGTRILSIRNTSVTVRTAHGTGSLNAIEGEPWDRSFSGRYDRISGATPHGASEIMASPAALVRLGAHTGDTVSVVLPKAGTFTIVGMLRDRSQPANAQMLFAAPAAFDGVTPESDLAGSQFYLPSTVVDWAMVRKINASGAVVLSRDVLLNPPPPGTIKIPAQDVYIPWSQLTLAFPLAGFALFEVALLAGAAFMVGARRQQHALATLASIGADRRLLFRVITLGGVVLGIIGGILGTALGVAGAWGYIAITADGSATQYPGFHLNALVLAGIVLFAALAGLLSASIPARVASKVDVVTALRGALRPIAVRRRRPVAGVVLACIGVGIALLGGAVALIPQKQGEINLAPILIGMGLVVLGPIVVQIGAILIAPLILNWVARLFARISPGARLGSRDASRNSSRSVPALAAIMTTVFVGAFVMTFVSSSQAQETATWDYWTTPNVAQADLSGWRPNGAAPTMAEAQKAADAIRSTFTVTDVHILRSSLSVDADLPSEQDTLFASPTLWPSKACPRGMNATPASTPACIQAPYDFGQRIWIGTTSDLALALGRPVSRAARAALAAGGVVSLYPQFVDNESVTIGWRTGKQTLRDGAGQKTSAPVRSVTLPATLQIPVHDYHFTMFMSAATARSIGLVAAPTLVLAPVSGPATDAQYDTLNAAATSITGGDPNNSPLFFRVEPGPPNTASVFSWVLLAVCAIIVLGAASVAIGLARADGRRDDYVLHATGAPPALRRSFGFWQAICLAGTGTIIGVVLGTLPVLAISRPASANLPTIVFAPPWLQLVLTAVAVPLLIASGSWLLVRTRRRASSSNYLARA